MSKTIDEKVVEMRFDNKHFETNVSTTLSTLDKLKAKLNLTGASKGLEEVNKASKKVDFSHMESSLAALEKRFSTTGIVGMTVIQNLTNAVMGFAKKAANFSIGGILEGGKSRATKIENARFQIKGLLRDYEDAQKRLDDIMADVNYGVESTAYGLDAAASVAAQLVASGMQAGDGMKAALRGISGVAAMTNSTYEDIGKIYTTVAGNGRLMGDQLLQLSSRGMNAAAVLAKSLNKTEAEVREMTSKGKISFEMFSKAMDDAFGEHAKDANKTLNGVLSNIRAALAKIGADFYGPLIAENSPLVLFLNSVRERINEFRRSVAPITEEITERINKMFTSINKWFNSHNLLGYNPFAKMAKVLDTLNKPIKGVSDAMSKATKTTKDYEKVVNEIIMGKWKNAPTRWQALTKAGYDWAYAQNEVNKKLGSTVRHTTKFKPAADKAAKSTGDMTKESKKLIEQMARLSEEELKAKGYTKEQIKAFKLLKEVSDKTGLSISDLLDVINKKDANGNSSFNTRFLILNSIKNVLLTITGILKPLGKAFGEVFNIKAEGLFDIVAGFHKLTKNVRDFVEGHADQLTRTFKGLFSILHIIGTFLSAGLKVVLSFIGGLLGKTNIDVLDLTANIGDAISNFDKWLSSNNNVFEVFRKIGEIIGKVVGWIGKYIGITIEWIKNNEQIMFVVNKIKDAFSGAGDSINAWIEGLKETDNIPEYIFGGLINGIKEHGPQVWEAIKGVAMGIVDAICNVLKIQSPSKVMFAIGGFIIAGLIAGMKDQQLSVLDLLKGFGNKIIEMFKSLDLGNVIAVGIAGGIIYTAKRMLDIADKVLQPVIALSNVLNGLGSALSGVGAAARDWGKAMKYQAVAAIIKSIAISIGILAAALWVLAKLPKEELQQGAIALGVIGLALAGFIGLVATLSGRLSKVKLPDMGKTLAVVIGVSVGMLIMAKALKRVAKIEPDRMTSAIFGLITCATAMAILIFTLGKVTEALKGTKNIEKMGKVFTKMSISMLLIAIALRMMAKVEWGDIGKMGVVVLGILALLGGIALINKFTANSINKSAETIKAVGVALILLVVAMRLCGKLEVQDFLKGLAVIGVFSALLLALMGISKLFKGTEMIKVTGSILMAAVAIGVLAIITKLMGNIDPDEMKKGLACVSVLSLIIMALIAVSKQSASLHGTTLIGVAMVMAAMGVMVFLLGQLDPEKAKNGLIVVGFISAFMAVLLQAAKNFNPGANAVKTLTTLTFMLALLAVALVGLSFIDQQKLMTTAGSLGAVILALAAVIAATGKMKVGKGVIKTLITVTLVVAAMAVIIALLSQVPNIEKAIKGSIGVAILSGTLALMVFALSKIDGRKNINKKFILGLYTLMPLLIGIAAALLVAGNVQNAIQNAIAISMLLAAMTGVLYALTAIGKFGDIKSMALGIVGLTVMAAPLWIFIQLLKSMDGIENAMTNVLALITLCSALTLLLIPLTILGAVFSSGVGALAGIAGIIGLCAMAAPLWIFIQLLKSMDGIENASEKISAITLLMEKLTECLFKLSLVAPLALIADVAIYGLIGAITTIGVLATAVGAIMEKIPQLQDFLNKGLPVLEQIALSIGKIIGNVVAGFMNSVAEELPHIGQKLSEFAVFAMPFILVMSTVTDKVMDGVKILAGAILALTGANFIDSVATFFSGGQSFSRLGTELSKFVINALPFIMTMNTIKPEVVQGAKTFAEAILIFTAGNFVDALTSKLFGERDYSSFANSMKPLGEGVSAFVEALGDFKPEQVDTISSGCEALKAIAEASDKMPKKGGFLQSITGMGDIKDFADKFGDVGAGIRSFIASLTADNVKFDQSKIDIVKSGCEALKVIADVAKDLPNGGGLLARIAGDNDIKEFAGKLGDVGAGIRGFVWELQKDNVITKDSVDKINAVNNIMWAIADLGKINLGDTSGKLEELGARLGSFGNKITEYVKGINTVSLDDLKSGKDKIDKIIEIANTLAEVSSEPIEQLGERLKNFATDALKKFIDGLNDEKPKEDASNAMKSLIDAIIKAMGEKDDDVKIGATNIIETATKALESGDHTDRASKAGLNILNGFINGMNDKDGRVWDKAYSIGRTAVDAINKATDENSPSKETFKTGKFFDQGFINGVKSLKDKIYSETYGVGDKARLGLGKAIRGVSNLISEGIDDEFTIRPVLDLSDVQSGAAAINGMLGTPSVGVVTNLNAISTGMRAYRQNGGNDVVSAIDKLGKNLGNTSNNTYNINGITYDDGSNISEAVQTLVRAARIERRK